MPAKASCSDQNTRKPLGSHSHTPNWDSLLHSPNAQLMGLLPHFKIVSNKQSLTADSRHNTLFWRRVFPGSRQPYSLLPRENIQKPKSKLKAMINIPQLRKTCKKHSRMKTQTQWPEFQLNTTFPTSRARTVLWCYVLLVPGHCASWEIKDVFAARFSAGILQPILLRGRYLHQIWRGDRQIVVGLRLQISSFVSKLQCLKSQIVRVIRGGMGKMSKSKQNSATQLPTLRPS